MKPDDIRRLYREVDPAMADEAATIANEATTDPAQARRLLAVLYSLSVEDRAFALLLHMFLEGMQMRLIERMAAQDDAFTLECAGLITELMDKLATAQAPVLRGRAGRTTKSV